MEKYISIEKANYVDSYKIHLEFDDGKKNIVDFEEFIFSSSHPDIKKYKNKKLFKNFNLHHGDIEWNDYDLVFPVSNLYEGKI